MPLTEAQQRKKLEAEYDGFAGGFQRSQKGNFWRVYNGVTLTVFARNDGLYGYCIATADGPQFSTCGFTDKQEALTELYETARECR